MSFKNRISSFFRKVYVVFRGICGALRSTSFCVRSGNRRDNEASPSGDELPTTFEPCAAPPSSTDSFDNFDEGLLHQISAWSLRERDDVERLANARQRVAEVKKQIFEDDENDFYSFFYQAYQKDRTGIKELANFFFNYLRDKNETAAAFYMLEITQIPEVAQIDENQNSTIFFLRVSRRVQEVFETCAERIFYDELKNADDDFNQTPLPKDFSELLRKCLETPPYLREEQRRVFFRRDFYADAKHVARCEERPFDAKLINNNDLDKLSDSGLRADDNRRTQQNFNAIIRRCLTEKEIRLLIDYDVKGKTFEEIAEEHGEGLTEAAYRRRRADILKRLAEYPAMQEFARENNLHFEFKKKRNKSAKNRKEDAEKD